MTAKARRPAGEHAPAATPSPVAVPGAADHPLLALQRQAGNAAVASGAALQRQGGGTGGGDLVGVDLEVPPPAERERLRALGIELPGVSPAGADPRRNSDYVDRRMTAVGYGVFLGGFVIYCDGLDLPVFVPDWQFDFGAGTSVPADLSIHGDRAEALASVPAGPQLPGVGLPHAYYRGAGGALVAPTTFSAATTPRVLATARAAQRELGAQVVRELTAVAIGLVGGTLLRAVLRRLVGAGGQEVRPPKPAAPLSGPAADARALARRLQAQGKPVVANLGGAGRPHEPVDAINVNNQAVPRKNIPNLIQVDGSSIGQLFDAGSVDQVVGYRMAPGVIDWGRAVPGIRSVLRPGGTFRYSYQGANADARVLEKALRANGFRNVRNDFDAYVTAER
jgi:hypothetical protein